VLSFAAWLYGMAQQRRFAGKRHLALFAVTAALILAVIVPLPSVIKNGAPETAAHIEEVKWSPQNVADNRGHGKAIFVNFCILVYHLSGKREDIAVYAGRERGAGAHGHALYGGRLDQI
jgi:hypothetical protein